LSANPRSRLPKGHWRSAPTDDIQNERDFPITHDRGAGENLDPLQLFASGLTTISRIIDLIDDEAE